MLYCRLCGQPTSTHGWSWFVCEDCEPYQFAVEHLASEYEGMIPEPALKALVASLNQYDTRTGQTSKEKQAQPVRESMMHQKQHNFYGAFKRPSQVHAALGHTSSALLDMVLKSGFLPLDLTNEIQVFLDEMKSKAKQLTRVLTYQQSDQQWCAFLADNIDETAIGKTETEAMEKIYQVHPELRVAS